MALVQAVWVLPVWSVAAGTCVVVLSSVAQFALGRAYARCGTLGMAARAKASAATTTSFFKEIYFPLGLCLCRLAGLSQLTLRRRLVPQSG